MTFHPTLMLFYKYKSLISNLQILTPLYSFGKGGWVFICFLLCCCGTQRGNELVLSSQSLIIDTLLIDSLWSREDSDIANSKLSEPNQPLLVEAKSGGLYAFNFATKRTLQHVPIGNRLKFLNLTRSFVDSFDYIPSPSLGKFEIIRYSSDGKKSRKLVSNYTFDGNHLKFNLVSPERIYLPTLGCYLLTFWGKSGTKEEIIWKLKNGESLKYFLYPSTVGLDLYFEPKLDYQQRRACYNSYDYCSLINDSTLFFTAEFTDSVITLNTVNKKERRFKLKIPNFEKPKDQNFDSITIIDFANRRRAAKRLLNKPIVDTYRNLIIIPVLDIFSGNPKDAWFRRSSKLMVYDEKFVLKGIIQLPEDRYSRVSKSIVTESGLWISKSCPSSKYQTVFAYDLIDLSRFGTKSSMPLIYDQKGFQSNVEDLHQLDKGKTRSNIYILIEQVLKRNLQSLPANQSVMVYPSLSCVGCVRMSECLIAKEPKLMGCFILVNGRQYEQLISTLPFLRRQIFVTKERVDFRTLGIDKPTLVLRNDDKIIRVIPCDGEAYGKLRQHGFATCIPK